MILTLHLDSPIVIILYILSWRVYVFIYIHTFFLRDNLKITCRHFDPKYFCIISENKDILLENYHH